MSQFQFSQPNPAMSQGMQPMASQQMGQQMGGMRYIMAPSQGGQPSQQMQPMMMASQQVPNGQQVFRYVYPSQMMGGQQMQGQQRITMASQQMGSQRPMAVRSTSPQKQARREPNMQRQNQAGGQKHRSSSTQHVVSSTHQVQKTSSGGHRPSTVQGGQKCVSSSQRAVSSTQQQQQQLRSSHQEQQHRSSKTIVEQRRSSSGGSSSTAVGTNTVRSSSSASATSLVAVPSSTSLVAVSSIQHQNQRSSREPRSRSGSGENQVVNLSQLKSCFFDFLKKNGGFDDKQAANFSKAFDFAGRSTAGSVVGSCAPESAVGSCEGGTVVGSSAIAVSSSSRMPGSSTSTMPGGSSSSRAAGSSSSRGFNASGTSRNVFGDMTDPAATLRNARRDGLQKDSEVQESKVSEAKASEYIDAKQRLSERESQLFKSATQQHQILNPFAPREREDILQPFHIVHENPSKVNLGKYGIAEYMTVDNPRTHTRYYMCPYCTKTKQLFGSTEQLIHRHLKDCPVRIRRMEGEVWADEMKKEMRGENKIKMPETKGSLPGWAYDENGNVKEGVILKGDFPEDYDENERLKKEWKLKYEKETLTKQLEDNLQPSPSSKARMDAQYRELQKKMVKNVDTKNVKLHDTNGKVIGSEILEKEKQTEAQLFLQNNMDLLKSNPIEFTAKLQAITEDELKKKKLKENYVQEVLTKKDENVPVPMDVDGVLGGERSIPGYDKVTPVPKALANNGENNEPEPPEPPEKVFNSSNKAFDSKKVFSSPPKCMKLEDIEDFLSPIPQDPGTEAGRLKLSYEEAKKILQAEWRKSNGIEIDPRTGAVNETNGKGNDQNQYEIGNDKKVSQAGKDPSTGLPITQTSKDKKSSSGSSSASKEQPLLKAPLLKVAMPKASTVVHAAEAAAPHGNILHGKLSVTPRKKGDKFLQDCKAPIAEHRVKEVMPTARDLGEEMDRVCAKDDVQKNLLSDVNTADNSDIDQSIIRNRIEDDLQKQKEERGARKDEKKQAVETLSDIFSDDDVVFEPMINGRSMLLEDKKEDLFQTAKKQNSNAPKSPPAPQKPRATVFNSPALDQDESPLPEAPVFKTPMPDAQKLESQKLILPQPEAQQLESLQPNAQELQFDSPELAESPDAPIDLELPKERLVPEAQIDSLEKSPVNNSGCGDWQDTPSVKKRNQNSAPNGKFAPKQPSNGKRNVNDEAQPMDVDNEFQPNVQPSDVHNEDVKNEQGNNEENDQPQCPTPLKPRRVEGSPVRSSHEIVPNQETQIVLFDESAAQATKAEAEKAEAMGAKVAKAEAAKATAVMNLEQDERDDKELEVLKFQYDDKLKALHEKLEPPRTKKQQQSMRVLKAASQNYLDGIDNTFVDSRPECSQLMNSSILFINVEEDVHNLENWLDNIVQNTECKKLIDAKLKTLERNAEIFISKNRKAQILSLAGSVGSLWTKIKAKERHIAERKFKQMVSTPPDANEITNELVVFMNKEDHDAPDAPQAAPVVEKKRVLKRPKSSQSTFVPKCSQFAFESKSRQVLNKSAASQQVQQQAPTPLAPSLLQELIKGLPTPQQVHDPVPALPLKKSRAQKQDEILASSQFQITEEDFGFLPQNDEHLVRENDPKRPRLHPGIRAIHEKGLRREAIIGDTIGDILERRSYGANVLDVEMSNLTKQQADQFREFNKKSRREKQELIQKIQKNSTVSTEEIENHPYMRELRKAMEKAKISDGVYKDAALKEEERKENAEVEVLQKISKKLERRLKKEEKKTLKKKPKGRFFESSSSSHSDESDSDASSVSEYDLDGKKLEKSNLFINLIGEKYKGTRLGRTAADVFAEDKKNAEDRKARIMAQFKPSAEEKAKKVEEDRIRKQEEQEAKVRNAHEDQEASLKKQQEEQSTRLKKVREERKEEEKQAKVTAQAALETTMNSMKTNKKHAPKKGKGKGGGKGKGRGKRAYAATQDAAKDEDDILQVVSASQEIAEQSRIEQGRITEAKSKKRVKLTPHTTGEDVDPLGNPVQPEKFHLKGLKQITNM